MLTLSCYLPVSVVVSLPFMNPLRWRHGIVNCPSNANFRFSPEEVGHLGTFCLLFYEYC